MGKRNCRFRSMGLLVVWVVFALSGAYSREPQPAVELLYKESVDLKSDEVDSLRAEALRFAESANFNSRDHEFLRSDAAQMHDHYRRVARGNYIVVRFDSKFVLRTVGGEIEAQELLVGLDGPGYASSAFVFDPEGRLIELSKCSGQIGIELMNAALKIVGLAPILLPPLEN